MKFLLFAFLFFGLNSSFAFAEDCKDCMAECPHNDKIALPCDTGCPGVCNKAKCVECMSECPHDNKNMEPCDVGCPQYCSGKSGRCSPSGKNAFDVICSKFTTNEECTSKKDGTSCFWEPAGTGTNRAPHLSPSPSSISQ